MRHTETTVHSQPHQPVRLSAIHHGVIGPQAQPVVGKHGQQVVAEEKQQADGGQKHADGFQVGAEDGQFDLRRRRSISTWSSAAMRSISP